MRSFRDHKRQMRRDVHREMSVPALYIPDPDNLEAFIRVTVRIHTKFDALGDQKGTNFNSAEREDKIPQILFWRTEVPEPKLKAIVSVEAGEAYRIGPSEPADDLTIKATIVVIAPEKTTGFPVPESI